MKISREEKFIKGMLSVIVMLGICSIGAGMATAKPRKTVGVPSVSSPGIKQKTDSKVHCYKDLNRNGIHDENEPIKTVQRSICDAYSPYWLEL